LVIGGQGGDGALRIGNRTVGYYNIAVASFVLQAQHDPACRLIIACTGRVDVDSGLIQ
jgi:hypothetical protein